MVGVASRRVAEAGRVLADDRAALGGAQPAVHRHPARAEANGGAGRPGVGSSLAGDTGKGGARRVAISVDELHAGQLGAEAEARAGRPGRPGMGVAARDADMLGRQPGSPAARASSARSAVQSGVGRSR